MLNIDITIFGTRFMILPSEGLVEAGARNMSFTTNDWPTIFYNLYIALFVKNSFGIMFFIVTISYLYLISLLIFKRKIEFFPQTGLFSLLFFIIIAALRYTDYFFAYSHPGDDTSLSRACMIIFLLGFAIVATAIGELSKVEKLNYQN